VTILKHSTAPT